MQQADVYNLRWNNFLNCVNYKLLTPRHLLLGFGQGSELHSLISTGFPSHDFPPYSGMGLVQVRDLDEIPPPQLDVHSVQLLQGVKPPFTGKNESKKRYQQNALLVQLLCKTIWRV